AKLVRPLFIYGGWVTVSNLIGPLLMRVDQFFIGALLSVAAVGYYTAPYEIATKIWLIPTSLLATIFPAFSTLHASQSLARMEELYSRSLKSILLVSGPALLVLAAWAWVLRISLDAALLFFAVLKLKFVSPRAMIEKPLKRALMALVLPAVLLPLSWINTSFAAQLALSSLILVIFVTAVWGYV